jgi:hypothetical protein
MLGSTGWWLLNVLLKWGSETDMFSEALVALVPPGSLIAMFTVFLWCAVLPLASRHICSQATRGLNLMLWVFEHIFAYHFAFASKTEMVM